MPAHSPEEIHRLWAEAYNAVDLESLVALYEAEAVLVPQPGLAPAAGCRAIREVLGGFLARKGRLRIEMETTNLMVANDLALLRSLWCLTGPGRDGKPVTIIHNSLETARRQADGSWRYVIDNPFGADGRPST